MYYSMDILHLFYYPNKIINYVYKHFIEFRIMANLIYLIYDIFEI